MNINFCRYLLQIKSKYGSEAELLIEELLQQAASTATGLLLAIANKYKDDKVGIQLSEYTLRLLIGGQKLSNINPYPK